MRLIGTLPTEPDARRFVDYLLTRTIVAHAEEGGSASADGAAAWQVWVEDDDHLDAGRAELDQFRLAPADARFDSAAHAPALRKQEAKAAEKRQRNFRDVRTTMFARPGGAMPVAFVMIGLSVLAYVVTTLLPSGQHLLRLALFDDPVVARPEYADTRLEMFDSILSGQLWRLVTPIFLHGGLLHLIFNMMWMLDLGRRIEPVKGSGKFLGLALVIAVGSNLAQAAWAAGSPWEPTHYSVFLGMSGVVAGLFGYAWMCGRFRPYERIAVGQQETGYMIGWLVICSFGLVGPIANGAHWGGLVVGMLIGAAPTWWRKLRA